MNFLGQGQGPSTNQGIGQGIGNQISSFGSGIGDKLKSMGSGISSGLSSATSGFGMGESQGQSTSGFDSFYTMVVAIAVIVLILVLAFLGWTMSKQKATDKFPKLQTSCPDFWKIETDPVTGKAYCIQPDSTQVNYGNASAGTNAPKGGFNEGKFDFENSGWSAGGDAVCAKKKWANSHGINWDTVTNANYC